MELNWGEADPYHFLGGLHDLCIGLNGSDVVVDVLSREGIEVRDWDESAGTGIDGTDRVIPWEDVERIFVY